ncbi:MAG: hypothetical protein JW744_02245 [Candidatus Diapherotrites archaeon]|uniref:Uncharacterized protein n=1 Tax=Candidatus Iainarchaeum sp. TaxID=3101447 RepID=A0A939C6B5_9ARCH|nr:hypothetical protein [Candidatus Diapherotrites archaeon]
MAKPGRPKKLERLRRLARLMQGRIKRIRTAASRDEHLGPRAAELAEKARAELEAFKPEMGAKKAEELRKTASNAEALLKESIENWQALIKHNTKMVREIAKESASPISNTLARMNPLVIAPYENRIQAANTLLESIERLKREKGLE